MQIYVNFNEFKASCRAKWLFINHFLEQGNIFLLSVFIMPKHVYTNFEAIASFYHEHTSICSFAICLKRLTFSDKNLYFLLLDI